MSEAIVNGNVVGDRIPPPASAIPQLILSDGDVRLWPVRPQDHEFLYWIAVCDENAYRWRFRGNIPSYEQFTAHLSAGILAQFVVYSTELDRRIGYVVAYDADLSSGHVAVGAVVDPNHPYVHAGRKALKIFVDYLFDTWTFRTIYAQVPEYIVEYFQDSDDLRTTLPFVECGRMPDFLFHKGEFHDMVIFALSRERFSGQRVPSP